MPITLVKLPPMCCGLVECLGRTPAEASGNCTRATTLYSLHNDLDEIARLVSRAATRRSPRIAANLRACARDRAASFERYAPSVIAGLPACGGTDGAGGACGGMTLWEERVAKQARLART